MVIENPRMREYRFLQEMAADPYYPPLLVAKGMAILSQLCERIESDRPVDLQALYALTHEATARFNELAVEFEDHDSEIETVARECIAGDFVALARAYGFDADVEALIAPRDW